LLALAYTSDVDGLVELLLLLAEFLLEVLFEFAGEALLDLSLRAIAGIFEPSRLENPVLASISYTSLGCLAGGFSLLVFPHPLVHPSGFMGSVCWLAPSLRV
jgi:hypothetical protein